VTATDSGPRLVVTSGAGLARQIPISFRGIVLGRDARLGPPFSTDEFVSRNHVWIRRRGDGVEVTDLGSANGTYVNGTRVRAPARMQDRDVLRIGRIRLKLTAPGEAGQATSTRESACVVEVGPYLTIASRAFNGRRRFYLAGGDLVVGRDPASGIHVDDPRISRIHAAFRRRGRAVYVEDLGSSSGTFVNGEAVTAARELRTGDIVSFADVSMRFDQPTRRDGAAGA
jgi:pSer/pThr/pTyr-binding forkhead associated (FHA) protein